MKQMCKLLLQITCLSKAPAEMTDVLLLVGIVQILNAQFGSWFDEYTLMCVMLVSNLDFLTPHLGLAFRATSLCSHFCAPPQSLQTPTYTQAL